MNTFNDEGPDGLAITHLVDGTLDNEARRTLLLQLDRLPGGWRACALAFLEDQALRGALAPLGRNLASGDRMGTVNGQSAIQPKRTIRKKLIPLAWAASVLVALGAGWFGGRSDGPAMEDSPLIADVPHSADRPAKPETPAVVDKIKPQRRPVKVATNVRPTDRAPTPLPGAIVPAVAVGPTDMAAMSPEMRARLERRGYQLEHRFGVAAVSVGNDQRVALPVEELKLRYVGYRTY